jgi:hypothetical protein
MLSKECAAEVAQICDCQYLVLSASGETRTLANPYRAQPGTWRSLPKIASCACISSRSPKHRSMKWRR